MKNSHKSYYLLVLNLILGIFGSCDKGEIETLRTDIHTEEESHTGTPLEEDNSAENLSFLRAISQSNYNDVGVETYRYEAIYDGKKIKSYKTYTNGHLSSSTEDSHNGLVCTLTSTYYDTNTGQETAKNKTKIEYLDDTYLRTISQSNYNDVGVETYRYEAIYDGKKIKSYKTYANGHLSSSTENSYNGLVCTLTSTYYDTNTGQETAKNKTKIEYLDDTYLRTISQSNYNDAGVETYRYEAIYDGKKIKSSKTYTNGHLSSSTENSYNGLVCTSTITSYDINIGKVIARNKIKIEYLE